MNAPRRRLRPLPTVPSRRWAFAAARRAFTLVEVLVALAIFALAAVVLSSSYLNILTSYEAASRGALINEDIAFARQIVLAEPDREKLEQGGEFDTAGNRHVRWTVEIHSTNTADLFNVVFTCEISDPARADGDKVTQNFTLLRPTWSTDIAERDKLRADAKERIYALQGKEGP